MGCGGSSPASKPGDHDKHHSAEAFLARYQLGAQLGAGAFAQVYAAKDSKTGESCAVKVMKSFVQSRQHSDGVDAYLSDALRGKENDFGGLAETEEAIWKKVGQHRHCLRLIDAFQGPKLYFMTMEKCDCTLMKKLANMNEIGEKVLSDFTRQLLLGLCHLHGLKIVHRDLKPDNILIDFDENLKICDFGLAAMLPAKGTFLPGVFGTPPFMSPEMVCQQGHNELTDLWSLGVILYLILFANFPYVPEVRSGAAMKEAIKVGKPNPPFKVADADMKDPSDSACEFTRRLLVRNSKERLSALQALEMPFVAKEEEVVFGSYTSEGIALAKQVGKEWRDECDATVQHDINELLKMLKPGLRKSFTGSLEKEKSISSDDNAMTKSLSRRSNKCSTHGGELSINAKMMRENMDSQGSDYSTRAPESPVFPKLAAIPRV